MPPVRLERMLHFVPPHIDKIVDKLADTIRQVDVVVANLEDAIPVDAKVAARQGLIRLARRFEFGATGLWVRINALNSPWVLDDVVELVGAIGDRLDVIMLPKVEGPWDIHYLDQLLAQLEARHRIARPIQIHALLETAEGVANVVDIAGASPADARHEPWARRSRGFAGDEDDPRRRRPSRLRRARRRRRRISAPRPFFQQDLWHYTIARMVDACASHAIKAFYGPFGDFADPAACEAQFRNAFLQGCAGAWTLHPSQVDIARRVFSPDPGGSPLCLAHPRGNARRQRRGDDRRQDAGRCDLEAGEGHRRPRAGGGCPRTGAGCRIRF